MAKDGTLLGIITMDDVLMVLGNEMGHIASALLVELRPAAQQVAEKRFSDPLARNAPTENPGFPQLMVRHEGARD